MKKIAEFKTLSMDELMQKERDLRKELFNLRFRHKMGELENPMKIREVRRDIARVKTIMSELGKRG
ncbi:MAG: 50S ribosomal protein L29 [Nitrospirota bacterium]|jgi:large subunit ribosomal protein L29